MKKIIIVLLLIVLAQSFALADEAEDMLEECFTDACLCVDCLEGE